MAHSVGMKRRTDFFEVNVTPKVKKPRDSDPPVFLTLAPFTLIPKVCFTNVKVNTSSVSTVHLRNPSDLLTEILLELNEEVLEIGLQFSSVHFSIPASSTEILEIQWKPTCVIQWRGKIPVKHLNGDKKFSYISIACSSVSPPSKKGTAKKTANKMELGTPKRTQGPVKPKGVTFCSSGKIPPCSVVTPIRRETYEVVKPTYLPDLTPSIKPQTAHSYSLSVSQITVDEDLESNFSSSRIITSSPQAKGISEPLKQTREPLKEFNFNTRPNTLFKKEGIPLERKPERKFSDSFDITEPLFERDSLDSPVFDISLYLNKRPQVAIKNDIEIYDNHSNKPFYYVTKKTEVVSPKTEKSFYLLGRPDSLELTFSNDISLPNRDESFWSHAPSDKVTNSATITISPKSFQNNIEQKSPSEYRRNGVLDRNTTTPPPIQRDRNFESLTDNFYFSCKSESVYFDTTFQVTSTMSPSEESKGFASVITTQQPVSFEISPSRPLFRKGVNEARHPSILKKEKKCIEVQRKSPRPAKSAVPESDDSVFTHKDDKISLYDEPDFLLHPYGVTTIGDPFSRHATHPREWLEKVEFELIKWLNSLLTPPIEMGSIVQGVDVKKLWDQSTASDLKIAPSREAACKDYVLSDGSRMTVLRKAAASLARSEHIRATIYNIRSKIDCGFVSVKDGISLYHNQGARVKLVQMCMYYNPLWLRIALEVLYERVIPLHEKKIQRGLVYFLKNHFLSDQDIIDKHKFIKSNHPQGSAFILEMNNFIVLKFLTLIYFLDQAKTRKLIPYDPCLFCKDSPIKESEGMLNEFIKEFLKCFGQFKKTLKFLGYKLEYCQKYLDEFDYGLSSHLDLRDGVRLTRTMEIILKDPSYSCKLWTPAFSRIQKIHNVQTALSALQDNGYSISSDISPTDIVNGHREKIFSLLWQILHKFLAPRYQLAAMKIQCWWRKNYLKVFINKQILMRKNIVIIQAIVRGFIARRRIKKLNSRAVKIQRWFRRMRECFKDRKEFIEKKQAAIKIQSWFRRVSVMRLDRKLFTSKKTSAILIQRYYRNYCTMKESRITYLNMRKSAVMIQKWFRRVLMYRKERREFVLQRRAAVRIQQWYRSLKIAKSQHQEFLIMKAAAIKIQRFYRNRLQCKPFRSEFLRQKSAAITIQRAFQSYQLGKKYKEIFLLKKKSAITIQRFFRAYLEMKKCRNSFLELRNSIISIQRWYRYMVILRKRRELLQLQICSAVIIQRWYRKVKNSSRDRFKFILLKKSTIKIQRWYRAIRIIRKAKELQKLNEAATCIQASYRGYITRKKLKPVLAKRVKKPLQQKSSSEGLILSDIFVKAQHLIYQNKQKNKDLGDLALAYSDLDVCVLFSPVLCLELTTYSFFYECLWDDIYQRFRFGPYLDICRHGLNIIIKLVKFPKTTMSLLESMDTYNGYEVLVSLMGKFLEKNTDIYCKAATVIWLLLSTQERNNAKKIKSKLDIERITFFHKKIMSRKVAEGKNVFLPPQKVDWGYFNKPVEFLSMKTASEEIMKLLNSIC